MSGSSLTHEIRVKNAEAKGCVIVFPAKNEVFVDIDDEEQLSHFDKVFYDAKVGKHLGRMKYEQRPSPSGRAGRYHIVVTLDHEIEHSERILLMSVFGGDPMHCLLAGERLREGMKQPVCFFERP